MKHTLASLSKLGWHAEFTQFWGKSGTGYGKWTVVAIQDMRRNMRLIQIGFSLLLLSAMANLLAVPVNPEREVDGSYRLHNTGLELSMQDGEQTGQRQANVRHAKYPDLPDSGSYSAQGNLGAGAQEGLRRQGKLSPEERRALRQQINEAGHDLYLQKP